MANIFSIFGQIFVDNEQANKKIDETTNKGKKSSKTFGESFADVTKKAMAIGTAVVGATTAIVGSLTAAANQTSKTADEIDKASIRMGINTKTYQELKYVANQCGVEMSTLEKAAKKLEGTDINMDDAIKNIMSLGSAEERARRASELFGDNIAYTLSPLIEQTSQEYDDLIQRANNLGLIMSDDAVKAGVVFGDTLSDVQQSLSAVKNNLMGEIIPILIKFLNLIIGYMPQIQTMINTLAPILVNLLQTILPIFIDFVSTILPIIIDLTNQLLPSLSQIIETILPIFGQLLQTVLPPIIQIVEQLLPVLLPLIDAILPLLSPILDLINLSINTILLPIINIITSISNVISKVLIVQLKALTPVLNGVKDIFVKVFGGLFNVVKTPINAIIDGINTFIKAINKIKVPDWVPGVGGKGINLPLIKKLRVGIREVPYDEMPAILHKGERVLTKDEAKKIDESKNQKSDISNNYYNTINIEKLEVKEENDIKRIAEELYYLQKRSLV